ncbi:hypothetical protein ACIPSE_45825 [Streptomyces sp. NPDC090106]|uniref:hypothetical protein n=1 Tax=Streptomyces sp. NPDC090106 TaxID=3365946 RepID=UPI0037FC2E2A
MYLVDWYARLGWKGANGKPLGENVVRREICLIREAGFVTTARLRGEGGKTVGIQYGVSQRRVDQPQTGAWIPAPPDVEQKRRSDHMPPMATRGESPHVVDGAKPQVAPHATNDVPPPHTPEEEEYSSPYPLTDPKGALPSQREQRQPKPAKEPEFAAGDLAEAERFLQTLPKPWGAGRGTARKCAPLLLAEMRETGWPSIHEVDQQMLAREILRNTTGARSVAHILPKWIKDLRLYSVVLAEARPEKAAGAGGREMCHKPGHGGGAFPAGDCPSCVQESRPRREGPAQLDMSAMLSALRGGQSGGTS